MIGLRWTLHWLWAAALHCTGAVAHAKRTLAKRDAVVVLTLHRVLDDAELKATRSLPGMVVRTETFRRLVSYVAKNYGTGSAASDSDSRLKICFTFDDGWIDTYTTAWPISRSFGIPITVFVCAGRMGCEMPFWPECAAELARLLRPAISENEIERAIEAIKDDNGRLHRMSALAEKMGVAFFAGDSTTDRTLSWQQLNEMARAGVTVGSHGLSHRILTQISKDQARWEMEVSKTAIERELSMVVTQFCYPNGNCSLELQEMVERCGYRQAFSTMPGSYQEGSPSFAIPRINISENAVVGPTGHFSEWRFQFAVFWKAWKGDERRRASAKASSTSGRTRWSKLRKTQGRSHGAIASSL